MKLEEELSRRKFLKVVRHASLAGCLVFSGCEELIEEAIEEKHGKITGYINGPKIDSKGNVVFDKNGNIITQGVKEVEVNCKDSRNILKKYYSLTDSSGYYSLDSLPLNRTLILGFNLQKYSNYDPPRNRFIHRKITLTKNNPECVWDIDLPLKEEYYPTLNLDIKIPSEEGIFEKAYYASVKLIGEDGISEGYSFEADEQGKISEKIYPGKYLMKIVHDFNKLNKLETSIELKWQENAEKKFLLNPIIY